MSEEKDIVERLKAGEIFVNDPNKVAISRFLRDHAVAEIERLRGEVADLIHDNRQLMTAANAEANEAERLRGEVERLTALASREGWVMVPRELLTAVLDQALTDSWAMEAEFSCQAADFARSASEREDIEKLRALLAAPKPEG